MRNVIAVLTIAILVCVASFAQTPAKPKPGAKPAAPAPAADAKTIKIFVQGETTRTPDFIEECQKEFATQGLKLQIVSAMNEDFKYNVILSQETSYSGAAASVVALDKKGAYVASVVRSGRVSGNSALKSASKELAKKLETLTTTGQ